MEFISEFGSKARNRPVTFLVEFKKHKHWGEERPAGPGARERVRLGSVVHGQVLRLGLSSWFLKAGFGVEDMGGPERSSGAQGGLCSA